MLYPAVDLDALAHLGADLKDAYASEADEWAESVMGWIRLLPIAARGAVGVRLAKHWLLSQGLATGKATGPEADCIVEDLLPLEVKFATRGRSGAFSFMQIRDEDGYSHILLLGVTPTDAWCWIVPRQVALDNSKPQHRGQRGDGKTRIVAFRVGVTPTWLEPFGGRLESVEPRPLLGL